jgi:hypothetical protein
MAENGKYEVKINEKKGSCNNSLFEKMAKNGDITATKLAEVVGTVVTILGYAKCTITTDEKTFGINYFDTEEYGMISSGSEFFTKSVENYFGEVEKVRLTEVKTKKGKTYKAQPILGTKNEETNNKEDKNNETSDDLPF